MIIEFNADSELGQGDWSAYALDFTTSISMASLQIILHSDCLKRSIYNRRRNRNPALVGIVQINQNPVAAALRNGKLYASGNRLR